MIFCVNKFSAKKLVQFVWIFDENLGSAQKSTLPFIRDFKRQNIFWWKFLILMD